MKLNKRLLIILIFSVCLFAVGCDDNNSNDADALCPDGGYDVDQAQYLNDTLYKMLGMLDEYITIR